MTIAEKIGFALLMALLLAMSPLIYEQGTSDIERQDENYWLERGFDPVQTGPWPETVRYELP